MTPKIIHSPPLERSARSVEYGFIQMPMERGRPMVYVDPRLGSFCLLQRAISISLYCGHTHIYPRDVHVYIANRLSIKLESKCCQDTPVLHDKGSVPPMGLLTMIEGIANLQGSSRRYEKLRRCSAAYNAVAAEATYTPSFFRSASKRRY
jgi:hypothetical protein